MSRYIDVDLISRQDAVSRIAGLLMIELQGKRIPTWDEVYNAMQDVPSAQQWIPCSERLPENEDYVLVTTSMGDVTEAQYWHKEQIWVKGFLTVLSVTAWMPLPEPYGGDK